MSSMLGSKACAFNPWDCKAASAAAQSLEQQAHNMVQVVSIFKTGSQGNSLTLAYEHPDLTH